MISRILDSIRESNLGDQVKEYLVLFIDKGINDGDTVARLEEEISGLRHTLSHLEKFEKIRRTELSHKLSQYENILNGDKPVDES